MKSQTTKRIVFAAVFAALIAVCTRFTAIPIPGTTGYVHVGDAFVLQFVVASDEQWEDGEAADGDEGNDDVLFE